MYVYNVEGIEFMRLLATAVWKYGAKESIDVYIYIYIYIYINPVFPCREAREKTIVFLQFLQFNFQIPLLREY
jgi:hypothetical protein